MKLFHLLTFLFLCILSPFFQALSQYPYQTFQSYERPSQALNYNQNSQAPIQMASQNRGQIQMPPRISSNSFMTQLSEKIKAYKFDKINPSPIIINGGNLAPLHIYHQPLWLPSIVKNPNREDYRELHDLEMLNRKIDQEIQIRDPFYKNQNESAVFQQKILIGDVNPQPQEDEYNRELIRHDIRGKSSNVYESITDPRAFFPKFKETIVESTDLSNAEKNLEMVSRNNETETKKESNNPIKNIKNVIKSERNGTLEQLSINNEKEMPDSIMKLTKKEEKTTGNSEKLLSLINSNNNTIVSEEKNTKEQIPTPKPIINMVGAPKCSTKKGHIKIREKDMLSKDVPSFFAYLSKDRLTYYLDEKDESSIQGSIELRIMQTPINVIQGTKNCFQVNTVKDLQNCSICASDEKEMTEWITTLTKNIINCNS